jgi:hypothetical protein
MIKEKIFRSDVKCFKWKAGALPSSLSDEELRRMTNIKIGTGYKIIETRYKRYVEHYQIPSQECLVVPLKSYGEDLFCEVRWEDEYGVLHSKSSLVFNNQNLKPINPLIDSKLFEIWQHYYGAN